MTDKPVTPGGTKSAFQFGRELKWQLFNIATHPHEICKNAKPDSLLQRFQKHIRFKKGYPGEFKLILFRSPSAAKGHHHHWIIIDDGYYADFFEKEFSENYGNDYRALSEDFLNQFCEFTTYEGRWWIKTFHVHIVKSANIGPDMDFWKEYVISVHAARPASKSPDYIRTARSDLWEIVDEGYVDGALQVGFKPVRPDELYVSLRLGKTA
jgi:hypothetical protein